MYGRTLKIPSTCAKPEEPQYNYEDYHRKLKQCLQAAHGVK